MDIVKGKVASKFKFDRWIAFEIFCIICNLFKLSNKYYKDNILKKIYEVLARRIVSWLRSIIERKSSFHQMTSCRVINITLDCHLFFLNALES